MAQIVLTDAFVSLAGNDISANVKSVTINYQAEVQDDTAMGDTTRSRVGGLKDWSIDLELHQDWAAAALDSILFPLVGTQIAMVIRPVKSTVVGTGNPNYTGTGLLESYKPLGGSVGDLAMANVTIPGAGTLTRATA